MVERDPSQTEAPGALPADAQDPTALIASRPAHNARQVESSSDVQMDWRGADEVADFLGLDQELRDMSAAPAGAMPEASPQTFAHGETGDETASSGPPAESINSWLLNLDEQKARDAAAEVGVYDGLAQSNDEPLAPAAEPDAATTVEPAWSEEAPARRSTSRTLVRAVAALAIAGAGFAIYKLYGTPAVESPTEFLTQAPAPRGKPGSGDVAGSRTNGSETPTPFASGSEAPTTASGDLDAPSPQSDVPLDTMSTSPSPADVDVSSSTAALVPTDSPDTTALPSTEFESWMRSNSRNVWAGRDVLRNIELQGPPSADALFDPLQSTHNMPALRFAIATVERDSADIDSSSVAQLDASGEDTSVDPSTRTTVRLNVNLQDVVATTLSKSRLRRATASDLAGVWEGSTVPMESIESSTRLLTPAVGRVRTVLHGGEIFEGRLYAVGQNKVWLDTEMGRLALVSDQIEKVEQLASPDGTPVLGQAGSQALAGLPRVRVRTPGGMFYGKVTLRDDRTVTMITDDGARITLENPIVEPVPASRTVIVGTVKKP